MRSLKHLFLFCWFILWVSISSSLFAFHIEYSPVNSSSSSGNALYESRKKLITTTLSSPVFSSFSSERLSVLIDGNMKEPRWRMKDKKVLLSNLVSRDSEFIKLFVHEFAHFIDIYLLTESLVYSDLSKDFYAISWIDTSVKRAGEWMGSFVTGYAATNKYEDFAESFVFYVFHNRAFADMALKNESLRRKYLFFSEYIFREQEFVQTDFTLWTLPSYSWDSTKIPISLKKYLYSLN
jgi:hypothetical protein